MRKGVHVLFLHDHKEKRISPRWPREKSWRFFLARGRSGSAAATSNKESHRLAVLREGRKTGPGGLSRNKWSLAGKEKRAVFRFERTEVSVFPDSDWKKYGISEREEGGGKGREGGRSFNPSKK